MSNGVGNSNFKIIRPVTIGDAQFIASNVPENEYPKWTSGTAYPVLSTYVMYIAVDVHQVYVSLVTNPDTTKTPPNNPTQWALVSNTNRWALFDQSVSSQTTNPNLIDFTIQAPGRIDSLVLLNLDGTEITVTVTDSIDGVVYSRVQNLSDDAGINNWYSYFFEPFITKTTFSFTGIPNYFNATIRIQIKNQGSIAKVGVVILGQSKVIGLTEADATVGIIDYSIKTRDAYGNYVITPRAFSRRANYTVWVEAGQVDSTINLLSQYKSIPILYIGCDDYDATITYGYFKDFQMQISYPTVSVCTIQLESLT